MNALPTARIVEIRVIPRSSRPGVASSPDGLVVRVRSVPEKGKATAEACRLLAEHFGVPVSSVDVLRGHTGRRKVVRVG